MQQFLEIRRVQFDQRDLPVQFVRDCAQRRRDDQELARVHAELIQVAQSAPDLRVVAHELMKILELKNSAARHERQ